MDSDDYKQITVNYKHHIFKLMVNIYLPKDRRESLFCCYVHESMEVRYQDIRLVSKTGEKDHDEDLISSNQAYRYNNYLFFIHLFRHHLDQPELSISRSSITRPTHCKRECCFQWLQLSVTTCFCGGAQTDDQPGCKRR